MRSLLVALAALAIPHTAFADASADVAHLVDTAVTHLGDKQFDATTHLGAQIVGVHGTSIGDYSMGGSPDTQALNDLVKGARKLGKVTVVVDGDRAFFQAPCQVGS